jgi:hypothetical protein
MNTDRIYQDGDDLWYFNVRGNLAKGPFVSFAAAEDALNRHVRNCRRPLTTPSWSKALKALKTPRRQLTEARHL